jgi:hypothetical protein
VGRVANVQRLERDVGQMPEESAAQGRLLPDWRGPVTVTTGMLGTLEEGTGEGRSITMASIVTATYDPCQRPLAMT